MSHSLRLTVITLLLGASNVSADTHFVSLASTNPTPPYTNSATAATNIQQAVNWAGAGDQVDVSGGVYPGGLTVHAGVSVSGWGVIIDGGGAVPCVSLADGASLFGLTLTNGACYGNGAGVVCTSTNAFLNNCTLSGNMARGSADYDGRGGGAYLGTLYNCTLSGNTAILQVSFGHGGGAYGSTLYNCTLTGNMAALGGGAYGCTLSNCTLTGNSANKGQGGGAYQSTLYNCTLSGNGATVCGGGAQSCTLYNCTVIGNGASGYSSPYVTFSGSGGGAQSCTLYNCTLTGNSASGYPPDYGSGGGAVGGTLYNCIVYFNTAANGAEYLNSTLNYCCTIPQPTNGVGNITLPPLFVDYAGGNLRLQSNSPCINAGNNGYVTTSQDLARRPRIISGTVDIGAYEYQGTGSLISYAWLQQYGLPTDGSADFAHADADGINNWQEWRCGTCPTDSLSALRLLSATPGGTYVTVGWQSVDGVTYFLKRSANPASSFMFVATNIVGQAGTTTYADTNVTDLGPFFYRVGVNPP